MMDRGRRAIIVVGLGCGDCGKGSIVDFLVRRHEAGLVVRFNGGPQAGHNVVLADGRWHTFSQFGSGTFVPGVRTFLSRFMLIEPYALFNENRHLEQLGVHDALERLCIDRRCRVITPAHQAANRLRELRRACAGAAHGTCGMGVGELMADAEADVSALLVAGELEDAASVRRKLLATAERKRAELSDALNHLHDHPLAREAAATLLDPAWVETAVEVYRALAGQVRLADQPAARRLLEGSPTSVFEGAQGVLLDEWHGFHPHTTWSTTTAVNADALLDELPLEIQRTRLGVLRTYATRHGAGPLVSEDAALRARLPEPHNDECGWQGRFRVGVMDLVSARYALAVTGGVDELALTHVDRLPLLPPRVCTAYAHPDAAAPLSELPRGRRGDLATQSRLTQSLLGCRPVFDACDMSVGGFVARMAAELACPVSIISTGPTAGDKAAWVRGMNPPGALPSPVPDR